MREEEIKNCCICGLEADTVYTIPFLEVYGMAKEYTQRINICPHTAGLFIRQILLVANCCPIVIKKCRSMNSIKTVCQPKKKRLSTPL